MPRQRQQIQVPFGSGTNQKTDQRALQPGQWSQIENGEWDKTGALYQRAGYAAQTKTYGGGSAVVAPVGLLASYNGAIVEVDATGAVGVLQSSGSALTATGATIPELSVTRTQIFDGVNSEVAPDSATDGTYIVRCWMANPTGAYPNVIGDIWGSIHDAVTGAVIRVPTLIFATNGASPKVQIIGGTALIVWWDNAAATLKRSATNLTTNPTFGNSTSLGLSVESAANGGYVFDLIALTSVFVVAYLPNGGNGISFASYNSGVVLQNSRNIPDANFDSAYVIGLTKDATDNVYVCWFGQDSGATVNVKNTAKLSTSLVVQWGPTALPAGFALATAGLPFFANLLWINSSCLVYTQSSAATAANSGFRHVKLDPATGTSSGSIFFTPGYYNLARPFANGTQAYILLYHSFEASDLSTSLQGALNIVALGSSAALIQPRLVATLAPRIAVPTTHLRVPNSVANTYTLSGMTVMSGGMVADGQYPGGRSSIHDIAVTFNNTQSQMSVQSGEALLIGGGAPFEFDGLNATETGFALYPVCVIQGGTTTGGNIGPGSYAYQVVYEYIDARGQRHQSAPCPAIGSTIAGGGGSTITNTITLRIPYLQLTSKTVVGLVLYRTLGDGSTYFRVTPDLVPVANQNVKGVAYVDITDTASDASIATNPLLYTTGGELPNFCPPAATIAITHKNRSWLAGTDEGKGVWYSKIASFGVSVEFNDAQTIYFPNGGRVTGLASLDDALVVFKSDRIFLVYGDGPNVTGVGADWAIKPMATDVGCLYPKSVVVIPDGVMFQSSKGMMLLSRAGELSYIGAAVEDTIQGTSVYSAVVVPAKNHVRFTLSSVMTVIYDYYVKQWSTWTVRDSDAGGVGLARAACIYNDTYYWAGANTGMIYAETSANAFDGTNGNLITLTAKSAWIRTSSILGFQRLNRVQLLTENMTNNFISLVWEVNYDTSVATTVSFPAGATQIEMLPAIQKCESMRLTVRTNPTVNGSNVRFLGLSLECWLDSRTFKGVSPLNRG